MQQERINVKNKQTILQYGGIIYHFYAKGEKGSWYKGTVSTKIYPFFFCFCKMSYSLRVFIWSSQKESSRSMKESLQTYRAMLPCTSWTRHDGHKGSSSSCCLFGPQIPKFFLTDTQPRCRRTTRLSVTKMHRGRPDTFLVVRQQPKERDESEILLNVAFAVHMNLVQIACVDAHSPSLDGVSTSTAVLLLSSSPTPFPFSPPHCPPFSLHSSSDSVNPWAIPSSRHLAWSIAVRSPPEIDRKQ
jgi:hypothetical protein